MGTARIPAIIGSSGKPEGLASDDTLNVTNAQLGLAATAPDAGNLNILGIANGESANSEKLLLDTTNPSTQAFGDSAAAGTSLKAARIDHKHAMPATPTTISGNAGTATKLAATKNINGVAFDGSADINITARWTTIATSNFTTTPASTSTITFSADLTATLKVGTPIKVTIGGVVYYDMVTAVTSVLLTVAGCPLSGTITKLEYDSVRGIESLMFDLAGFFAYATDTAAILNQKLRYHIWSGGTAHAVRIRVTQTIADTGTQNKINIYHGGTSTNNVCTSNSNLGLILSATPGTEVSTVVDINTTYNTVNDGDRVECLITKVGNGDAKNANIIVDYVYE